MFNLLVDRGLEEPAARSGGGVRARRLWQLHAAASSRRCVPRPQSADRHADDRGRGPRTAGGRAARHLSDRDGHERHAWRRSRPLDLGRGAVDRLRRVRLGHRDLSRAAAGRRAPRGRCRGACRMALNRRWARSPRSWARSCWWRSLGRRFRRWSCARSPTLSSARSSSPSPASPRSYPLAVRSGNTAWLLTR